MPVTDYCICTVVAAEALKSLLEAAQELGGPGPAGQGIYRDSHPWLVARELLDQATSRGERMPVMFAVSPQPGSARGSPLAGKSPQPGSARGTPLAGKSPQPGSARGSPSQERALSRGARGARPSHGSTFAVLALGACSVHRGPGTPQGRVGDALRLRAPRARESHLGTPRQRRAGALGRAASSRTHRTDQEAPPVARCWPDSSLCGVRDAAVHQVERVGHRPGITYEIRQSCCAGSWYSIQSRCQ